MPEDQQQQENLEACRHLMCLVFLQTLDVHKVDSSMKQICRTVQETTCSKGQNLDMIRMIQTMGTCLAPTVSESMQAQFEGTRDVLEMEKTTEEDGRMEHGHLICMMTLNCPALMLQLYLHCALAEQLSAN